MAYVLQFAFMCTLLPNSLLYMHTLVAGGLAAGGS
jgi:hypothetical protein